MVKNGEFDKKKMKNGTNYVSMAQFMSHPVLFYELVPSVSWSKG